MMNKSEKVYVAGGDTLIGRALLHELKEQGYTGVSGGAGESPVLTDAAQVDNFFRQNKPGYVFFAAGKSGGIAANRKYPADLMLNNLLAESHVINSAFRHGVKKLLYLASSCAYPKDSPQPMRVESLLTGALEPTSEAYAVAKLAGIKLCQAYRRQYGADFIAGIPADAFGPYDNFDISDSHVVAALLRKMHEAKEQGLESVEVWGSGNPRRDFIFAYDLADACIFVMNKYNGAEPINLSGGVDFSIKDIAELIRDAVGYKGRLTFNKEKPDGMPLKTLDSTALKEMGWRPRTQLLEALSITYEWFKSNV